MITLAPAKPTQDAKPGQWFIDAKPKRHVVAICCPECEGEFHLARHYVIGATGLVNPVVHCPLYGCSWKQPVTLSGWSPL
jgi:hypothetical protein